jgi:hypothetical protein
MEMQRETYYWQKTREFWLLSRLCYAGTIANHLIAFLVASGKKTKKEKATRLTSWRQAPLRY